MNELLSKREILVINILPMLLEMASVEDSLDEIVEKSFMIADKIIIQGNKP